MNMSLLKTEADSFRYERKFVITEIDKHGVESIIRCHPASFSEIFHERSVNNIYFDSADMSCFMATECGASQRIKIRIRWYGSLFGMIEKPVLELKIKEGQVGSKISFPLAPFEFNNEFSFKYIKEIIKRSDISAAIKEELALTEPTLITCYPRKYFRSADNKYRLTLDHNMEYYLLDNTYNTFRKKWRDYFNVVLELKYSKDSDSDAQAIVNHFPFRLSRNSKYMTGVDNLLNTCRI